MKKSIMTLSAMCLLPLGVAVAGPECKTKCASKAKSIEVTTVAKSECAKAKCDKATVVAAECNFKCEKSVAKLFTSFDKDQDGKLNQAEFMALVNATMNKQPEAKTDKATVAN